MMIVVFVASDHDLTGVARQNIEHMDDEKPPGTEEIRESPRAITPGDNKHHLHSC